MHIGETYPSWGLSVMRSPKNMLLTLMKYKGARTLNSEAAIPKLCCDWTLS
jgi:hypothetical protein